MPYLFVGMAENSDNLYLKLHVGDGTVPHSGSRIKYKKIVLFQMAVGYEM
jgi:hypothetical protein